MAKQSNSENKKQFIGKHPNDKTMMRCSFGLLMMLEHKAHRGESYEDVIWRMLRDKLVTQDDKKEFKKAGYEKHI